MTDREIIEKLATEFMGWHSRPWAEEDGGYQWVDAEDNYVAKYSPYDDDPQWMWNPLVDPAACALVKAELRQRGYKLDYEYLPGKGKVHFFGIYDMSRNGIRIGRSYASTEERAVCLAVLAACGVAV